MSLFFFSVKIINESGTFSSVLGILEERLSMFVDVSAFVLCISNFA